MLSHPTAAISLERGARLITGMRTTLEPDPGGPSRRRCSPAGRTKSGLNKKSVW